MVLLEILGEAKRGGNGKGRGNLAHDRELCTLCGGCAPLCPADALTVHETFLVIDGEKCTACGSCVPGCPTGALRLEGAWLKEQGARDEGARSKEQGARDAPHFSAGSVRLQGVEAPDFTNLAPARGGARFVRGGPQASEARLGEDDRRSSGPEVLRISPGSSGRAERGSQ